VITISCKILYNHKTYFFVFMRGRDPFKEQFVFFAKRVWTRNKMSLCERKSYIWTWFRRDCKVPSQFSSPILGFLRACGTLYISKRIFKKLQWIIQDKH